MILTDEICDKLCAAAREKSKEIGIDISFAVNDENGLRECTAEEKSFSRISPRSVACAPE